MRLREVLEVIGQARGKTTILVDAIESTDWKNGFRRNSGLKEWPTALIEVIQCYDYNIFSAPRLFDEVPDDDLPSQLVLSRFKCDICGSKSYRINRDRLFSVASQKWSFGEDKDVFTSTCEECGYSID